MSPLYPREEHLKARIAAWIAEARGMAEESRHLARNVSDDAMTAAAARRLAADLDRIADHVEVQALRKSW